MDRLRSLIQSSDHRRTIADVLGRIKLDREHQGETWIILAQAPMGKPARFYATLVQGRMIDHARKFGDFTRSGRVRFKQAPEWVFEQQETADQQPTRIDTDGMDAREYLVARLLASGNTLAHGSASLGLCPSGLHRAKAGLRRKLEAAC